MVNGHHIYWVVVFLVIILIEQCAAESGYATYYTLKSCQREGNKTGCVKSGTRYDEQGLTCARRSFSDLGHFFSVSNPATGKSIIVQQNDYGPGKGPARAGVIIDLTPAAFKSLGADLSTGKIMVVVSKQLKKEKENGVSTSKHNPH